MKIMCICRANMGRSQMAAALLKKMLPQHTVVSAGTKVSGKDGVSHHGMQLIDTPGAEKVVQVLQEEGIDMTDVVRTQLSEDLLDDVDMLIVLNEPEHLPDYAQKHPKVVYWELDDLKDASLEFHREIRERLKGVIEKNTELFA